METEIKQKMFVLLPFRLIFFVHFWDIALVVPEKLGEVAQRLWATVANLSAVETQMGTCQTSLESTGIPLLPPLP